MTPGPTALEADAVQALAVRWLPCLGDDDFVCSPAGLWLALAAVASGARGRTAGELRDLLGVDGESAAVAVTAAGRRLGATDGVALATGVWSRVPVLDGFRRGLPDVRFGVLPGAARFALPDEVFGATDDMSPGRSPTPRANSTPGCGRPPEAGSTCCRSVWTAPRTWSCSTPWR